MSSIKVEIKNKYRELQHIVRQKINSNCLLDLVEENIVDMLLLFNFHFRDLTLHNHKELIDQLFEMSDDIIEQTDRNLIYKDIYHFLVWLKNLQSM